MRDNGRGPLSNFRKYQDIAKLTFLVSCCAGLGDGSHGMDDTGRLMYNVRQQKTSAILAI